ncbi:hypothetical protein BDZ91DRAFT_711305, partial [Kalaharituber pfeilii]
MLAPSPPLVYADDYVPCREVIALEPCGCCSLQHHFQPPSVLTFVFACCCVSCVLCLSSAGANASHYSVHGP